jgi:hypothetical protein
MKIGQLERILLGLREISAALRGLVAIGSTDYGGT